MSIDEVPAKRRRRSVPKPRRRTINTERAQQAAARLFAGVCRELGWLWNRQEGLLAEAHNRAQSSRP